MLAAGRRNVYLGSAYRPASWRARLSWVSAYYNENDAYAAQWLRNLIKAGHIAPGEVDERDIRLVQPEDLRGFGQCHFFAGIGGWSRALRLAGWQDERPCWTASVPCQPYSVAASLVGGGAKGQGDERDLWPCFYGLVRELNPSDLFGEQVASAIQWGWWDRTAMDLEAVGYAAAAVVLRADAVGADHERKRLYWCANAGGQGREGLEQHESLLGSEEAPQPEPDDAFAPTRSALAGDFSGLRFRDGVSVGVGRSRTHGYGNAIVPKAAAAFIRAYAIIEAERQRLA